MSLNLNVTAVGRGRPSLPLDCEVVRELRAEDLELFDVVQLDTKPPELQRLSDRHHALARLLAAGTPEDEAAMITGYGKSRISILKNSPAFQELLAIYREEKDLAFASALEHMAGLGQDALLLLRERIEDNPLGFSNRELLAMATELTDRAGTGEAEKRAPDRIELVAFENDDSADSSSS